MGITFPLHKAPFNITLAMKRIAKIFAAKLPFFAILGNKGTSAKNDDEKIEVAGKKNKK